MKFRKKPVVIEAVRVSWQTWGELCEFMGVGPHNKARSVETYSDKCGETAGPWIEMDVPTLEGDMTARHGDWIIRGVNGEFYPCKPDVFAKTYEPVDD